MFYGSWMNGNGVDMPYSLCKPLNIIFALFMKKNLLTTVLLALPTVALVSCEQSARVVERPLGQTTTYPEIGPQPSDPSMQGGSDLLNQLQGTGNGNETVLDPLAGNTSGNGGATLGNLLGGNTQQGATNSTLGGSNVLPNSGTISQTGGGMTPSVTTPAPAKVPTAWPDPGDPTVVRSPYDQSKKIRITRPDGTRHPSGTILWDPNYPKSEKKQFRVP